MILTAANAVVGDGKTLLRDTGVLVDQNGRIGEVAPLALLRQQYPHEPVTDYGDATLLPGLCDMHVHLGFYYSQPDLFQYDDFMIFAHAQYQCRLALDRGITTVRDMCSPHGLCQKLRLAAKKGYLAAPRIIHSDAGMCMSGGHGHGDGIEQVDGPWNIRTAIRRQLREGADWIKLLTSHRSDIPEFTQEELDAAVDECHRRGVKTAVHAGTQPSIQMCIDAGFDTIEHGTMMTVQQAHQMLEKGLSWTPTIYAYTYLYRVTNEMLEKGEGMGNACEAREMAGMRFYQPAFEAYKNNFKKLYDTGVRVLAGSDMVMYGAPPLPVAKELALMVEYGLSPLAAIQTATQNPAIVLGLEDEMGLLQKGLCADLLVVEGDASAKIENLEKVAAVFQNGRPVYQSGRTEAGSGVGR
jgi:imidazolonepropionase-like amidohydrolase